jgi:hypothetical protein
MTVLGTRARLVAIAHKRVQKGSVANGDLGCAAPAKALNKPRRDVIFPENTTTINVSPARRFEGWVDVFGTCFGFVHAG